MSHTLPRREFLAGLGLLAAAPSTIARSLTGAADSKIRFGYASITWGGDDARAIADISALGFRGVQLRANILDAYGARPQALRDLLAANRLEFVAMSSGAVALKAGGDREEIAKHARHAEFLRDAGGRYLQVTDNARPASQPPTAADFKRLGALLTEIGKRAGDVGIPVGYHNHMSTLGETPDDVRRIMDAADPRHVRLLLDIAHYRQGGGDPARAVREYKDRLLFLHIKDVQSPVPATGTHTRAGAPGASDSYRFVELGQGKVDLPAVFDALRAVRFDGWAVVELDRVPEEARTPKEAGAISKRYIEERLRLKV